MRKMVRRLSFCLIAALLIGLIGVIKDREQLKEGLIRFHVVANSNEEEDQAIKLEVRDAVLQSIQFDLASISDMEEAKQYLQENLPKIETVANTVLEKAGFKESVDVSLCLEAFDRREYDTFQLPAGVYEALRIVIGDGQGENWWCVTFPALCLPATAKEFSDTAVEVGFSQDLADTLSAEEGYEIRFFLFDILGELENARFSHG